MKIRAILEFEFTPWLGESEKVSREEAEKVIRWWAHYPGQLYDPNGRAVSCILVDFEKIQEINL